MADPGKISDATRDNLKEVREGLPKVHNLLFDLERLGYERARGKISNSYEFLQLVLKDPWFEWLRRLSELIVQIDETLDAVASEKPLTEEDASALISTG